MSLLYFLFVIVPIVILASCVAVVFGACSTIVWVVLVIVRHPIAVEG